VESRDDGEPLLQRYAWAENGDPLVEAISITLVRQPTGPRWPRSGRAARSRPGQALAEAFALDDFAWASIPETLARLSIGSRLQPVALQLQHHVCVSSNGAGPATRSSSCTVGKVVIEARPG
jgi:hypothetical protein